MTVVSLDLAAKRYADNGLAVVRAGSTALEVEFIDLKERLQGRPEPKPLADLLASLAEEVGSGCILIDGPQAWKSGANGLEHQRICEKALHTPGKTGEPGIVKPASWTGFVEFSIALFDALEARGYPRLADPAHAGSPGVPAALESFPTAAWRGIGLKPLPAKTKVGPQEIRAKLDALREIFPLDVPESPSHDELQALVASIGGIAFEQGRQDFLEIVGVAPHRLEGSWREGYIVGPALPSSVKRVRRPIAPSQG